MDEIKVWILLGANGFIWLILTAFAGVILTIIKSFVKNVLHKFDVLINQIEDLKITTVAQTKDIQRIDKILEHHHNEINYIKNRIK